MEGIDRRAVWRGEGNVQRRCGLTFRHEVEPVLGPRLVATSELWAVDHFQPSADSPEPFTVHQLMYDEDPATPEPTLEVV